MVWKPYYTRMNQHCAVPTSRITELYSDRKMYLFSGFFFPGVDGGRALLSGVGREGGGVLVLLYHNYLLFLVMGRGTGYVGR